MARRPPTDPDRDYLAVFAVLAGLTAVGSAATGIALLVTGPRPPGALFAFLGVALGAFAVRAARRARRG
jgi:hypothetical protein